MRCRMPRFSRRSTVFRIAIIINVVKPRENAIPSVDGSTEKRQPNPSSNSEWFAAFVPCTPAECNLYMVA